ncbi:MAG: lytic transglycosylase domain-containing protein [bacterium]
MEIRLLPLLVQLCCCAVFTTPRIVNAQIYSGANAEGDVILSNFQSTETNALLVTAPFYANAESKSVTALSIKAAKIPRGLKEMVDEIAREHRLDPLLLHAVIKVESGYNPQALSPKGARGLMQLMPDTARRFGVSNAFDPRENVQAGARYLTWLLALFKGDIELALAGYNAGEQAVIRAGYRLPRYPETERYVPKVLRQYRLAAGS